MSPLSLADDASESTSESVRLFVARAAAAVPTFSLTDENRHAVGEICAHLDGIPLAIELAAARLRALTPEQVVARLDDCLRLLVGGSRTALPRQRTLAATLDWSFYLLTAAERVLLARLSVFAGGWTLQAAEVVGSGAAVAKDDVVDLLIGLIDKSLVLPELQHDEARYRQLEPIRQYGAERLGGREACQARCVLKTDAWDTLHAFRQALYEDLGLRQDSYGVPCQAAIDNGWVPACAQAR